MGRGMLEVHLLGATGIKKKGFFGKRDSYADLTCWKQQFRSTTAKRQGTASIWNQKFLFSVEDGPTELFIKLYNEDRVKGDTFIGSVNVPLKKVLSELEHPLASYDVVRLSGKIKGQVKIALTFIPNVQDECGGSSGTQNDLQ